MAKIIKNSETIVDDNGIEIIVGYEYEAQDGYYEEPGNIASFVDSTVSTTLQSVEIVIAGIGLNILPLLTKNQQDTIISKLEYE